MLIPAFDARIEKKGPISFSVRSFQDFYSHELPRLRDKGFFTVFIPSGVDDLIKAGHLMVFSGDALFDRNLDSEGGNAVRSVALEELSALSRHFPFAVFQFFETSSQSETLLTRFFHDRTWLYHSGATDYQTQYVGLPLSGNVKDPKAENCSTFSLSFLFPYWQSIRPELTSVKQEFGTILVDQVPSRQIFNNTLAPSYRATFILTQDPQLMIDDLKKDGLRNDQFGSQLQFEGAITAHH